MKLINFYADSHAYLRNYFQDMYSLLDYYTSSTASGLKYC